MQGSAKFRHVFGSGAFAVRLERDQDLTVVRTNGRVVAESEAVLFRDDAKIIQNEPDVFRADGMADLVFHGAENLFCLLNAGAGRRANMEPELSSIDTG